MTSSAPSIRSTSSKPWTSSKPFFTSILSHSFPPVTVLRPVCDLEKNLKENLRSICVQDYPEYQIVFSVQRAEDPAIPILQDLQKEFGSARISLVIKDGIHGSNGKVNNLIGGLTEAKHGLLIVCDSDVMVRQDYVRSMVTQLVSPSVGLVCSLHKSVGAKRLVEKLEVLSINVDYMPSVIFTFMTGVAKVCLGPSVAIRRSTLQKLGGFEGLADYLAEDHELGRRVWGLGKRVVLSSQVVDTAVDIDTFKTWWTHQLYWDLNLRAANPAGFFGTVLIRSIPFAILLAMLRTADLFSLAILAGAVGIRLLSGALVLRFGFGDSEGLRHLALLPVRDLLGFASWAMAYMKNTVVWRDKIYRLRKGGKMSLLTQKVNRDIEPMKKQALMR
ncbi:MAG: bacteriohopanetetrol glucosamine biosynthesis glycosyltransferase HpnI [Nitrospirales bacterium]|nr:bacteriohopanetetrol glucosamine biosynthesis glycosyltransferase HpnI [Nitrospirales bacterium]